MARPKKTQIPHAPATNEEFNERNEELYDDLLSEIPTAVRGAQVELILNNRGLAYHLAKQYSWACGHYNKRRDRALEMTDLQQAALIGLWVAAQKFEPSRGNKFSTMAFWWIRQSISRMIQNSGTIRIPVHMVEAVKRYEKVEDKLRQKLGDEGNHDKIRKELGLKEEAFKKIEDAVQLSRASTKNTDQPAYGKEAGLRLGDLLWSSSLHPESAVIGASEFEGHQTEVDKKTMLQAIVSWIMGHSDLSYREKRVITRRFGLFDKGEETLDEIGQSFDVTRERIRQIEVAALRKLKKLDLWRRYSGFVLEVYGHSLTDEQVKYFQRVEEEKSRAREKMFKEKSSETNKPQDEEDAPTRKVIVPLHIRVQNAMLLLESEYDILSKLNGWDGIAKLTIEQTAEAIGTTVERVMQIQLKAIKRLRSVNVEVVEIKPAPIVDDNTPLNPQFLVEAVCEHFKITKYRLSGRSASNDIGPAYYATKLVVHLLCNRTTLDNNEIAKLLNYQRVTRHISHEWKDVEFWAQHTDGGRDPKADMKNVIKLAKEKQSQSTLKKVV